MLGAKLPLGVISDLIAAAAALGVIGSTASSYDCQAVAILCQLEGGIPRNQAADPIMADQVCHDTGTVSSVSR
jgi:hypothetical protein